MFFDKHIPSSVKIFAMVLVAFLVFDSLNSNSYAATYSASITTSGDISIDVSAAHGGASVSTDTLNVISTCPSGYEVLISGLADTTLYMDGDSSNVAATKKIPASSGTSYAPRGILGTDTATNTSNVNTWGYSTTQNTTINSTSFIGLTSEPTVAFTSNAASAALGDDLTVYYGVSVDTTIEPGTYTMAETSQGANDNVITYAVVTVPSCMNYTVVFNPTSTAGGKSLSGTGTMDSQAVREDLSTALSAVSFTPPSGYTFDEWNTAQDGTGTSYDDGESVTNLTTAGSSITLYAQWKLASKCALTPANNICYDDNGADSPTDMGNQTVSSGDTEVNLWASNFQRPGYGFAGWSKLSDAADYLDPRNSRPMDFKIYGPNETINYQTEAGSSSKSGLALYAVWVEAEKDEHDNPVYFQDVDRSFCRNMEPGEVKALTDSRDGEVYAVAKLADGNCWMIENLRLAGYDSKGRDIELTTSNTNNPFTDHGIVALVNVDSTGATITNPATSNHLSASVDPTGTGTAWCTGTNANCENKSMIFSGNVTNPVSNMSASNGSTAVYSYGNYYNWYSATAGNGTISISNNNTSVSGDICPGNVWHLPKGGDKDNSSNSDFWQLGVAIVGSEPANTSSNNRPFYSGSTEGANASKAFRSFPNNYIYSGYIEDSSIYSRSSGFLYWSATADSFGAYPLSFYSNNYLYPGTDYAKRSYGITVRCMIDG